MVSFAEPNNIYLTCCYPDPDCDSGAFDAVDLPNIRECVDWGKRKAFIA